MLGAFRPKPPSCRLLTSTGGAKMLFSSRLCADANQGIRYGRLPPNIIAVVSYHGMARKAELCEAYIASLQQKLPYANGTILHFKLSCCMVIPRIASLRCKLEVAACRFTGTLSKRYSIQPGSAGLKTSMEINSDHVQGKNMARVISLPGQQ